MIYYLPIVKPYVVLSYIESAEKNINKDITDKGFLSTSCVKDMNVFLRYPVKLEVVAKKGTNAFFANNVLESEVIFGRNTKMIFNNFRFESGKLILECSI